MNKRMNYAVAGLILMACLTSCVTNTIETKKKYDKSAEYTTLKAVSVAELRDIVRSDTEHYKVIHFYQAASPMILKPYVALKEALGGDRGVRVINVITDCGGLKYAERELREAGLTGADDVYYLRDDSEKFRMYDGKNINPRRTPDLMGELFVNAADYTAADLRGFYIADPKGNLKKLRMKYDKGDVHSEAIGSMWPTLFNSYQNGQFGSGIGSEIRNMKYDVISELDVTDEYAWMAIPAGTSAERRAQILKAAK